MKTHSQIGADALHEAILRVQAGHGQGLAPGPGPALEFLQIAQQIALSHHEKWDGSGYPRGLAGDDIPVAARLMALADVFDALSCKRHYKEPFPIDTVVRIITEGRGRHFDPDVVDAFLALQPRFVEVAMRYADIPPRHALG